METQTSAIRPVQTGQLTRPTTISSEKNLMQSLTNVTALDLAKQLPTEVTLSLLTIQEEVSFEKTLSAPIISKIEATAGRPVLIKLVCAVLKLFVDSMNITQTLTALQVYELAQLWIEKYPTDTLKDLILCLKRVKQGEYGKIYNRIDIQIISEFWTTYLNDKAEYRENQWLKQKAAEASNEKQMLGQIAEHAPQTANMIKTMIRPTPAVSLPAPTTHESYVKQMVDRLPSMYLSELVKLRQEAEKGGKATADILVLVDEEIGKRNKEIAETENV